MKTKFYCEECGAEVDGREYKEDIYVVERHYECQYCGFCRHWVYGYITPEDSEYRED